MIKYGLCKSTALFPLKSARSIKPGDAYDYTGFCEVLKTSKNIEGLGLTDCLRPIVERIRMAPVDRIKDLVKIRVTEYYIVKGEWVSDIQAFTPDTFEIVSICKGSTSYEDIISLLI